MKTLRIFLLLFLFCSFPAFAADEPEKGKDAKEATPQERQAMRLEAIGKKDPELKAEIERQLERAKTQDENDEKLYSRDQIRMMRPTISAAGKDNPEGEKALRLILSKYPKASFVGCALFRHAMDCQKSQDKVKYLKMVLKDYEDVVLHNGVQLGAFARYFLSKEALKSGDRAKSQRLMAEIKDKFPNAFDGRWNRLGEGRDPKEE